MARLRNIFYLMLVLSSVVFAQLMPQKTLDSVKVKINDLDFYKKEKVKISPEVKTEKKEESSAPAFLLEMGVCAVAGMVNDAVGGGPVDCESALNGNLERSEHQRIKDNLNAEKNENR